MMLSTLPITQCLSGSLVAMKSIFLITLVTSNYWLFRTPFNQPESDRFLFSFFYIYSMLIPLVVLIIVVLGIVAVLVALKRKKEGKPQKTDYRAFFAVGICFLASGTALMSTNPASMGLTGLGLVYMVIGLANRDKWPKKKKKAKKK